jgi:hypothetical protein
MDKKPRQRAQSRWMPPLADTRKGETALIPMEQLRRWVAWQSDQAKKLYREYFPEV